MSWGGKNWTLGKDTSMPPVYGSRIPLSSREKNLWVIKCPCCDGPLQTPDPMTYPPDHEVVTPSPETMWLAKIYANALLRVWLDRYKGKKTGIMPVLACAVKAISGGVAHYYIAGPKINPCHADLHLPRGGIIQAADLEDLDGKFFSPPSPLPQLQPRPRPEEISENALVIFCDIVLNTPVGGGKSGWDQAKAQYPDDFWNEGGGQMQRMLSHAKSCAHRYKGIADPEQDADGAYGLLECAEQRLLLCHRWMKSAPAMAGLPPGGELKEMTVALIDYQDLAPGQTLAPNQTPARISDFAQWHQKHDHGSWWHGEHGFPMHPCNTCRVAIPALLCTCTTKSDCPSLPGPTDVIKVLP